MSSLDTLADRLGRRLARLPFRRKLNVLIAVPLAMISVLIAVYVNGQVSQAQAAAHEAGLLEASGTVAELVDDLQQEQGQAILYFESYSDSPKDKDRILSGYMAAQHATDRQVEKVRAAFGSTLPPDIADLLNGMSAALDTPRTAVADGKLPTDNIDTAYNPLTEALLNGLHLTAPQQDQTTARLADQLEDLLWVNAAHAQFETALLSAQTGNADALSQFSATEGAYRLYRFQLTRFGQISNSQAHAALLAKIDFNGDEAALDAAHADLQLRASGLGDSTRLTKAQGWQRAMALQPSVVAESQRRLSITRQLVPEIAAEAHAASVRAWWQASLLLGLAALMFFGWVALLALIRRSILGPLQRVTEAARRVSELSAQELARVADEDSPDGMDGTPNLEDLPILAEDEIGELAKAFNQVQQTAGALLERQVLSRRNIAEMFGNVGRRVANLTGRQLTLIDSVERGETDPELLDQLYRIDHIAVRLQRNADSLMLLAGIRDTELDGRPAELTHVVRAALGQIEGFERVRLAAEADATVSPDVVGDMVLMLAELLENAVSFSPAHSEVAVTIREQGGQAVLEIVDHGLGMSSERLAEENARLVRRERLDLAPTRVLGLFVVGALARRWGIQVTLARTPGGGVTSRVAIPTDLVTPTTPRAGRTWSPNGALTSGRGEPATPALPPANAPAPAAAVVAAAAAAVALPTREAGVDRGGWREPVLEPSADLFAPRREPEARHARPVEPTTPALPPTRVTRELPTGPAPAATSAGLPLRKPLAAPTPEPAPAASPEPGRGDESRGPLRRRVRGATLREGLGAGERIAPVPADPEEVRSALEEFEDAVNRAELESTQGMRVIPENPGSTGTTGNPKQTEGVGQ
ncbi:ATP-binding protein [Streptacidiphilus rugosus]|uniref:ATP-binding protein n=1 Tax=Streptacidiphilus rugosus TaxID=405783 RepID=UPI00068CCD34|nr:ATP-binding protein [Streptacidiphilus rugosus]